MALPLSDYLQTDDLTILLALIAATVFLLNNLYKPQPLVHPILLGRQSDVGRARNPTESAVYRNYGTGLMGRFPIRPNKDVHILLDLVRPELEAPRTLWSTRLTNSHLQDRAAAFGTGLLRLTKIQPARSSVLLLLNDSLEFIVADLALASHSILSYTITDSTLLSPVLDTHPPSAIICHAFFLPQLLELIYDSGDRNVQHTIVVVGEPSPQAKASVASNVKVYEFEDIEREGFKVEKILTTLPKSSDPFTVSFYQTANGQLQAAQFTHENMTAGVAAIRALFPMSHALSPLDTLTSSHTMSSPYGRAIAYTAVYEGTSFASVPGSELFHQDGHVSKKEGVVTRKYPIPSPTVMFIKPAHLSAIVNPIVEHSNSIFFFSIFAWRHKLAALADGFISNQSLWDRLVFDHARAKVLDDAASSLRSVVVSGGLVDSEILTPARVALSVPLVNVHTDPLSAAPVLATHPFDLQEFPSTSADDVKRVAPSGPPGVNVEIKLVGVNDEVVEAGGDPRGVLLIRGPPVGKVITGLPMEDYVDIGASTKDDTPDDGWTRTETGARVMTNGSFVLLRGAMTS